MIFKSLFILCFFLLLPSTNLMANADVLETFNNFYNEFKYEFNEHLKEADSQPKLGGNLIPALRMLGYIKEGIPAMEDKVKNYLKYKSNGTFIIIENGLKDILNVSKTMIHLLKQEKEINGEIEKKPAQLLEAAERLKAPQKEENGMDLGISKKIDDEAAMAKKRLYFIEKLIKMCKIAIKYLNIIYEELQTVQRDQGEHSADAGTSSIHSDNDNDKAIVVSAALDNDDKYNPAEKKAANVIDAAFNKISLPAGSLAKVELFLGDYIVLETVQQKKEAIENCNEELSKIRQRSDKINKLKYILEEALKMPVDERQKKYLEQAFEMFAPQRNNRILLFQIKEKFVDAMHEFNSRREFHESIQRLKERGNFPNAPKEFDSTELEYIKEGNKLFQDKYKSFLSDIAKNLNLMSLIGQINYLTKIEHALIIKSNETPNEMNKVQKCEETMKSFDQLIEAILRNLFDISVTDGHQHNKQNKGEQKHSDAGSSSIHPNNDTAMEDVQPSHVQLWQQNPRDFSTSSIRFNDKCNPEETANVIAAAFDKMSNGPDYETPKAELIIALVNCRNEQRPKVKAFLDKKMGIDKLKVALWKKLSTDLAELLWELMKDSAVRDVKLLGRAMREAKSTKYILQNKGDKIHPLIIEIMISRNGTEWRNIKRAYYNEFRTNLEGAIEKYIPPGKYRSFFIDLCAGIRCEENDLPNQEEAKKDASTLYGRVFRIEDFMRMLAIQSYVQLRLLFEEYDKLRKPNSLEQDIKEYLKYAEDVKDFLLSFIAYAKNPHFYFATRFEETLQGYYKDINYNLIRLVVTRENDLASIRNEYKEKYGKDLLDEIKSKTGGFFQYALVALFEKNSSQQGVVKFEGHKRKREI